MFEKEWFPKAYAIGVEWEQFWRLNPYVMSLMIEGYNEREKASLRKQNYLAHLQGAYFTEAINATVGNVFRRKGAKPHEYPKAPYEIGHRENEYTEEELQRQRELFVAKLEVMKANFELSRKQS